MADAMRAAETEESREAALHGLDRDRYAVTTQRSRAAWLRTWVAMHEAAYSGCPAPPAPFPLSCDSIRRVASLFKAGGYLSFENYAMAAKSEHLSLGLRGHGPRSSVLRWQVRSDLSTVVLGLRVNRSPWMPSRSRDWICRTLLS